MKITFILPTTDLCGGVRIVFEYANRLQKRENKVFIVYPLIPLIATPGFSLKSLLTQVLIGIKNILKTKKSWFKLKVKTIRVFSLSPRFIKIFERLIPDSDIIIATSWETAYVVNKLSQKKGKKFYFIQHYEIWDVWSNEKFWDMFKGKSLVNTGFVLPEKNLMKRKFLVDKTYKMPLKKIVVSSWLKEMLEKVFKEKSSLLKNPVNVKMFYKERKKRKNKKVRILIACSPIPWKGSKEGIEALKIVKQKFEDIEFQGYGTKKPKNLPSWIKFYEKISDEKLRKLYNNSDIFVYPSRIEGFGLPATEAMVCGCAVASTDNLGIRDLGINGKNVLLSPSKNPKMLAENVIKLIENKKLRKKIAKQGYEHVKKYIKINSFGNNTKKLEKILKNS